MGYSAKQKKVKVSLEGKDKIVKTLKTMGDAASDVLEKAALKGGDIALDDAKANCPVKTGQLRKSLHLSLQKKTNVKATVKVDYDKSLKYGTYVELGTRNNKPNPFLRNAVDNNLNKINDKITEEVAKAVGGKM